MPSLLRLSRLPRPALRAALAACALLAAPGCEDPGRPEPPPAELRLAADTVRLAEGSADTLSLLVLDAAGREIADARVSWSSADTTVAVVDQSGVVTARRTGRTQVSASVARGRLSPLTASVPVVVHARPERVVLARAGLDLSQLPTVGRAFPLSFRVLDRGGAAVPHVRVSLQVAEGGGAVSVPSAVTDSAGEVHAVFTLGPAPGRNRLQARVEGVSAPAQLSLEAVPVPVLRLEPDSLVLPAPGCVGGFLARIRTPTGEEIRAVSAVYSVSDSTVISLVVPMSTGTYRGQSRLVVGRKPGETRVVASYSGAADTALVRVLPQTPAQVRFLGDTLHILTGDTIRGLDTRVTDACGQLVPDQPVTLTNLDPDVVSIDAQGRGKALADGTARIVARSGALADTLIIRTASFRLVPEDTTVGVGATVRYQLLTRNAGGSWVPFTPARYVSQDGRIATVTQEGVATAVGPGEGVIYVFTHPPASGWIVRARLRVASP